MISWAKQHRRHAFNMVLGVLLLIPAVLAGGVLGIIIGWVGGMIFGIAVIGWMLDDVVGWCKDYTKMIDHMQEREKGWYGMGRN